MIPTYRTADIVLDRDEVRMLLAAIKSHLEDNANTAYNYGVAYQEASDCPQAQADLQEDVLYWTETYGGNGRFETWPAPETTPCPDLHRKLASLGRAYHTMCRLLEGVRAELLDNDGPTYRLPEIVLDLRLCTTMDAGNGEDCSHDIEERLNKKLTAVFGVRTAHYTTDVDGFIGLV